MTHDTALPTIDPAELAIPAPPTPPPPPPSQRPSQPPRQRLPKRLTPADRIDAIEARTHRRRNSMDSTVAVVSDPHSLPYRRDRVYLAEPVYLGEPVGRWASKIAMERNRTPQERQI